MKTAEAPTVGRPAANVTIPKGKFTFQELCAANSSLAPLTLRNFMKRDKQSGKHSQIVRVEDERGEPGSNDGYGRKPFLYVRRELMKQNGLSTRNVGYHIHTAKAPTLKMKRTELPNGREHSHKIIHLGKPKGPITNGASVTISFATVPNGAPIPTSVTVNFNRKSSESVTVEHPPTSNSNHETEPTTIPPTQESTDAPQVDSTTPTAKAA
jgi:hypothetical protein